MSWAYRQNSTRGAFDVYNKGRMTVCDAIVSAVWNKIVADSDFDLIVPIGTAGQKCPAVFPFHEERLHELSFLAHERQGTGD